ncbi:MAG TPA: adenylate/guanylate cyclase domain-containing protein [Dehalococcoidia bacterium]|nr:adenylate/guanylate cyclase domain-containing protein [Dehalococcoidia bacterium]
MNVTDEAATIEAPTLIMYPGDGPDLLHELASEVAAVIPKATMRVIPTASSRYENGNIDAQTAAIVDFLGELEGAAVDDAEVAASSFQTILFTDLESSTALTQRVGDEAAQEVLRGHNTAVRGALESNGGREVKHTGDGIMASFPSAVSAVEASLAIQRELEGSEVRVRIGINAGEPIAEDDDLFGTAVQLAARITDRAEPGQVLVSRVVMNLCAGKQFEFTSAGDATMKGFDEPVALYAVGA